VNTTLSTTSTTTDATSIGSHSEAIVYFTIPNNNGTDITQYQYSLNGGAKQNSSYMTSPMYIPIPDNVMCTIRLYAVSAAGTSPDGFNVVTLKNDYLEAAVPSAPVITNTTGQVSQLTVTCKLPNSNGLPISNYWYALNGSSTYIMLSNTNVSVSGSMVTLLIPNVPNNVFNTVMVKAANATGQSLPSNQSRSVRYVYLKPSAVNAAVAVNAIPGSTTVTFNTPAANGAAITSYNCTYDTVLPPAPGKVIVVTNPQSIVNNPLTKKTTITITGLPAKLTRLRVQPVNELGSATNTVFPYGWSAQTASFTPK
jgi:hypothetical protein